MNKKNQSIRLFKSDLLESLSRVHPVTPLVIFVPVLTYICWLSLEIISGLEFALTGLFGLLFWTFFEYSVHRFLFHSKPIGPKTERLLYLFHGIHHDDPHDPMRLVMPPTVSIGLSSLIYLAMLTLLPAGHAQATFFGFMLGYLAYDMGHYAIHHFHFKNPLFKFVRKHHYVHHFSDPENGYGVSSPLWDYVFGSTYKETEKNTMGSLQTHGE